MVSFSAALAEFWVKMPSVHALNLTSWRKMRKVEGAIFYSESSRRSINERNKLTEPVPAIKSSSLGSLAIIMRERRMEK